MFELNTLRFAIGFTFVVVYLVFTWQLPSIDRGLIKWTLLGILATYIFNLTFYNEHVKEIPIAAVFGAKQAFYIFLGALASKLALKERLGWVKIALIFATFIGIGLVISSSFLPVRSNGIEKTKISNKMETNFSPEASPNSTSVTIPWCTDSQIYLHSHEYTAQRITISITLIFMCQICAIVENLAISGTGLKDVDGVILAFWYFLSGTLLSFLTSVTIEDIFIPNDNIDRVLSVIHCTAASAVTFTYIFAVKLMNPALLAIVFSIHIPSALTTQMFLLQSVTPPVELWVLILGLVIITLSVFIMSVSAVCFSK